MEYTELSMAGSAVFWRLQDGTDYDLLTAKLTALGWRDYSPEPTTRYSALRQALLREFNHADAFAVQGVPDSVECVTRRSDKSTERNEFLHVVTAKVVADEVITDLSDYDQNQRIVNAYRANRRTIPVAGLAKTLVSIAYHLGGTTLRPNGGVYWVPEYNWSRWLEVANAVESSNAGNSVYAMRVRCDEHALKAIRDALAAEIEREATMISDALENGLEDSATVRRANQRAIDLRDKIAAYENCYDCTLSELRERLDSATVLEAKSALLAAVS